MTREVSFLKMLESTSDIQFHICAILEAKAMEAEKSRNWLCRHVKAADYPDHGEHVKQAVEIHEQLVAVIGGLTKLEYGLGKNLKVILGHQEDSSAGGRFGSLFDQGEDS
ncbi:MAG TPA: restriction endonuclease subunit S [Bacilli bacterium]